MCYLFDIIILNSSGVQEKGITAAIVFNLFLISQLSSFDSCLLEKQGLKVETQRLFLISNATLH